MSKNFAEKSKTLLNLKIILLDVQNHFIGNSKMSNAAKNFDIFIATSLITIQL